MRAHRLQESNIILTQAYEYSRWPRSKAQHSETENYQHVSQSDTLVTSRYLGLIVVPGYCITRMTVESAIGSSADEQSSSSSQTTSPTTSTKAKEAA